MKFSTNKEDLLKGLQKVTNIIGSKTTIPILSNILVTAGDGMISMTTSDLELTITTKVPAIVEEEGSTTIPAKKLIGLVSKFRGKTVVISSNENFHSTIECETARIMLAGINPQDFPVIPPFTAEKTLHMKGADFCTMISKVSYSTGPNDSRKVLQGILLAMQGGMLSCAATDGKRLAVVQRPMEEGATDAEGDTSIIITLKFALEVERSVDGDKEIFIRFSDNMVQAEYGDTVILSKIIDGVFPNVQQVIPKEFKTAVVLPSESVVYAMEVLGITMSESKTPAVQLNFKPGQLVFEGSCTTGEGFETVPIDYNGPEMTISFNPVFLLDPFKHVPMDNMTMKINDVFTPVVLDSNEGFVCVIMPMRGK